MTQIIVGNRELRIVVVGENHVLRTTFQFLEIRKGFAHTATSNDFKTAISAIRELVLNGGNDVCESQGRRPFGFRNDAVNTVIAASPDDAHGENTVQALRFGERCATITNSTKIGAVSATQALRVVDEALAACEQSMANLEAKERTNLPAYAALKARHASLKTRRATLSAAP